MLIIHKSFDGALIQVIGQAATEMTADSGIPVAIRAGVPTVSRWCLLCEIVQH